MIFLITLIILLNITTSFQHQPLTPAPQGVPARPGDHAWVQLLDFLLEPALELRHGVWLGTVSLRLYLKSQMAKYIYLCNNQHI